MFEGVLERFFRGGRSWRGKRGSEDMLVLLVAS